MRLMTPFCSASSWRASARFKTDDGVSGFRSPNVTQFGPRWRGDTPSPAPSATPWHPWARTPRRGRARPRPRAPPTRPTARARGRPCLISSAGARWLGTRTPGTSPRARPRARGTAAWPSRPSRIPRSSKPSRRGGHAHRALLPPRRRRGDVRAARVGHARGARHLLGGAGDGGAETRGGVLRAGRSGCRSRRRLRRGGDAASAGVGDVSGPAARRGGGGVGEARRPGPQLHRAPRRRAVRQGGERDRRCVRRERDFRTGRLRVAVDRRRQPETLQGGARPREAAHRRRGPGQGARALGQRAVRRASVRGSGIGGGGAGRLRRRGPGGHGPRLGRHRVRSRAQRLAVHPAGDRPDGLGLTGRRRGGRPVPARARCGVHVGARPGGVCARGVRSLAGEVPARRAV